MLTETLRKMCQDVREQRSKMILKKHFYLRQYYRFQPDRRGGEPELWRRHNPPTPELLPCQDWRAERTLRCQRRHLLEVKADS